MRHLKHITTEPVDFIDEVISSKKAHKGDSDIIKERNRCKTAGLPIPATLTYKEKCTEIRNRNKTEIEKYKTAFDNDDLIKVPRGVPISLNGSKTDCDDMDGLYSFSSDKMGKLWTEVLSSDGYLNDLCPVCEAVKAKTFDHYLPQSQYQLFAVHPLNLIPCCTVCNGHKLKNIFDATGKRRFWNAYLDDNTTVQYLFCDIGEDNGMPTAYFRVEQGTLGNRYFEIVKNSFDDLCLNDSYQESSGKEIVRLKDSCCKYFIKNQADGIDACILTVADTIPDTEVNYWVNVLDKALIGTDIFKRFVTAALIQEYGIDLGTI